jgi:hypothetical protein
MKKSIIYVELVGGLGNQIFLLEMAKAVAKLSNSTIYLNKFHIDRKHSNGQSTIEDFILGPDIKYTPDFRIGSIVLTYLKKYLKWIGKITPSALLVLDGTYQPPDYNEVARLVSASNPKVILIIGFWQNFSYWTTESEFVLKNEGFRYLELCTRMVRENPIVFHYRLGRLKNSWEHSWGALSPNYLVDSLVALDALLGGDCSTVWIFSNDLEMARELLAQANRPSHFHLEFVDDSNITPGELLKLFAASKSLICSNSTFSLIAAKIGKVSNVVVPAQLSKISNVELQLPENWIRIDSSWLA